MADPTPVPSQAEHDIVAALDMLDDGLPDFAECIDKLAGPVTTAAARKTRFVSTASVERDLAATRVAAGARAS